MHFLRYGKGPFFDLDNSPAANRTAQAAVAVELIIYPYYRCPGSSLWVKESAPLNLQFFRGESPIDTKEAYSGPVPAAVRPLANSLFLIIFRN